MKPGTLLIGKRKSILRSLSSELTREGIENVWVNNISHILEDIHPADYDLIVFGRGIEEGQKKRLREKFRQQKPDILFVDALAPIMPLLVSQIKVALNSWATPDRYFALLPFEKTTGGLKLNFVLIQQTTLNIELYRLNWFYQLKQQSIMLENLTKGHHYVTFPGISPRKLDSVFIVVKDPAAVLAVGRPTILKSR
jgi:hypothetical protein